MDVPLLQGIGRMSMGIAGAVQVAARQQPELGAHLRTARRLLDVGTGAGWLAVAFAQAYPDLRVVGIDIFTPVLELARANVRAEGLDQRIDLELCDVTTLDAPVYDVVWLPLPFLPEPVVPAAMAAAARSLRPGGWLIAGTFAPAGQGRQAELMMDLRTVRSGGRPWRAADLLPELAAAGFTGATQIERTWSAPVHLFVGHLA